MKRKHLVKIGFVFLSFALGSAFVSSYGHTKKIEHHHFHSKKASVSVYKGLVNINKADIKTLVSLKGVGPKKAQTILAYRQKHGAFRSMDQLKQVRGISAKFVKRLLKNNPGRVVVK